MNKDLEKLKLYFNNGLPLSITQGLQIVSTLEKELGVLEIIKEYAVMNRAFKDLTRHASQHTLIEIKALIPDEIYNIVKEVLFERWEK